MRFWANLEASHIAGSRVYAYRLCHRVAYERPSRPCKQAKLAMLLQPGFRWILIDCFQQLLGRCSKLRASEVVLARIRSDGGLSDRFPDARFGVAESGSFIVNPRKWMSASALSV